VLLFCIDYREDRFVAKSFPNLKIIHILSNANEGLFDSLATMVNYHYHLQSLSENREKYAVDMSIPLKKNIENLL